MSKGRRGLPRSSVIMRERSGKSACLPSKFSLNARIPFFERLFKVEQLFKFLVESNTQHKSEFSGRIK